MIRMNKWAAGWLLGVLLLNPSMNANALNNPLTEQERQTQSRSQTERMEQKLKDLL